MSREEEEEEEGEAYEWGKEQPGAVEGKKGEEKGKGEKAEEDEEGSRKLLLFLRESWLVELLDEWGSEKSKSARPSLPQRY